MQVILGLIKRDNSIQEFQPLASARKSGKLGDFFPLLYPASSFKTILLSESAVAFSM